MLNLKKGFIYLACTPIYLLSLLVIRKKNLWIFSAWYGRKYGDNPRYLYEYASQQADEVVVFWITKSLKECREIKSAGVQAIYCYSIKGLWLQLRAGTAICSHSISDEFIPWLINRKARKVNLWHGVPLKKIGKDVNSRKEGFLKNLINFFFPYNYENYFLFASTSTKTNSIYEYSFTVPINRIQAFGYPRNDHLCMQESVDEALRVSNEKRLILYAPTYRNKVFTTLLTINDLQEIEEICHKFNMYFDIKLHPADHERLKTNTENFSNIRLLDQNLDLNEILPNYDLLVSDYSGVIVDYLLLGRPIILYIFDYLLFKKDQGLYDIFDIFLKHGELALDKGSLLDYLIKFAKYQFEFDNNELLDYLHDYKDNLASERYYRFLVDSL